MLHARNLVEEFFEVQKQALKLDINHPPVKWTPPPETVYKANFDAALFEHLGLAGLGVVFQDSGGNIIAALSQKIKLPQTVELVEALVARRAVTLAAKLSVFKVMVEGDCMRVVQALNGHGRCLTMFGHVVEETRRLGSCLEFCSFHHVKREGNKLAHSLARRAVLFVDMDVWVEELPEDLDVVFQGDLAL
uniref:RNase H type-1 domain-containing protein n=1 Tax=Quercus lobata TaxID=97700 RepID=A0A7N2LNL5_QUELO